MKWYPKIPNEAGNPSVDCREKWDVTAVARIQIGGIGEGSVIIVPSNHLGWQQVDARGSQGLRQESRIS